MQEESVYLVLGCYGRKEDGFTLCPSAENRILKVDDSLVYIDEIWDYLEAVRLLDKPLIDINAIRNLIFKMQDRFDQRIKKLWSEKQFNAIERFIHMHKSCGLYVKLAALPDEKPEQEEAKVYRIKGSNIPEQIVEPSTIRVSRARR